MTSHSELTNTFTVGSINPIDPDKPGPEGGEIPEKDKTDETKLKGNLYEPSWIQNSKIFPSAKIDKDPYVGVGPGSEASVVYVYVKTTMANNEHIYFDINAGWEAVEPITTKDGAHYIGGIFKYTSGLDAENVKDKNVWTTNPLFSKVIVSENAVAGDFVVAGGSDIGEIKVQAFIHQAKDANKGTIDSETILEAAKKAFKINN